MVMMVSLLITATPVSKKYACRRYMLIIIVSLVLDSLAVECKRKRKRQTGPAQLRKVSGDDTGPSNPAIHRPRIGPECAGSGGLPRFRTRRRGIRLAASAKAVKVPESLSLTLSLSHNTHTHTHPRPTLFNHPARCFAPPSHTLPYSLMCIDKTLSCFVLRRSCWRSRSSPGRLPVRSLAPGLPPLLLLLLLLLATCNVPALAPACLCRSFVP